MSIDYYLLRACGILSAFPQTHVNGGFQLYTVVDADLVCPIPLHISFEEAVVVPVGWWTAASAILDKANLGLCPPTFVPRKCEKTVLVWGGSSSVGCNAIQILRLAGYAVVATASTRNHVFLKTLGVAYTVDYQSPNCKGEILEALEGQHLAGVLDCVSSIRTLQQCVQIVRAHPNSVKKVVSVNPVHESESKDGVEVTQASMSKFHRDVAGPVWKDFMPVALNRKWFLPKPDSEIVGQGLDDIQKAVDIMADGVSAKKLVVILQ